MEPLQNKNSAAALFSSKLWAANIFCVEKVGILKEKGNSKAGPAGEAVPEMWKVLFFVG